MLAMASIAISFLYIFSTDLCEIANPTFDSTLSVANFAGIPYFFGIASFMFEGNALMLEIYTQMDEPEKKFSKALGYALFSATSLIVIIGAVSYAAYG